MSIRKRLRHVLAIAVTFGAGVAAGCNNVDGSCANAIAEYEQLRADAIAHDPALAAHPELAAEHLRQTRELFAAPVRARCAADPHVARCIAQSATVKDADKCL
jgi:hypothetical protein